ncbi:MAG: 16S rRNA processing protein RimM [Ignavibacteriae bacterium]|nr:16S rRNA processing protein RimM [Ignavibacteriota bacterium]
MKKEKIRILGNIAGTKGLGGFLILSDTSPDFKGIKTGSILKIGYSVSFTTDFLFEELKREGNKILLKLKNIDSREIALELKDKAVFTDEKNIMTDGSESYYIENLIGCEIIDIENNNKIGIITDVLTLPANDVWLVDTGKGELPVPFIEDVVKKVDIKNKKILIKLIDGLMDLISNEKEN